MRTTLILTAALLAALAPGAILACDPGDRSGLHASRDLVCPPLTTSTPFTNHPANPIFAAPAWLEGGIDCFSVARDEAGFVMLFTAAHAGEQGFFRLTSPDGIAWSEPDSVPNFPRNEWWYGNIKCPDLQFRGGLLHLYFKGVVPDSVLDAAIGYAFSTDRGSSWSVHPTPVLTQTERYEAELVDAPSVVRFGAQYVMSYMTKAEVEQHWRFFSCLAFSDDGLVWTKHPQNPILGPSVGGWYDYAASRARLLVDPFQPILHMFFTGTTTGGNRCGRFGRAFSVDGGVSWEVDPLPVLDLPASAGAWNDGSIWCGSFTWNDEQDLLSLYFVGLSTLPGSANMFGVALADWPLDTTVEVGQGLEPPAFPLQLIPMPNPSTSQIAIRLLCGTGLPATRISLRVYDLSGRFVRELWSGETGSLPGVVSWDGLDRRGKPTAAGRYLVRAAASGGFLGGVCVTRLR